MHNNVIIPRSTSTRLIGFGPFGYLWYVKCLGAYNIWQSRYYWQLILVSGNTCILEIRCENRTQMG